MRVTPRLASIKLGDCPLFEIARVLVRFNHIANRIVNANHGAVRAAIELGAFADAASVTWDVTSMSRNRFEQRHGGSVKVWNRHQSRRRRISNHEAWG
jgi:hypothetical protein